MMENFRYMWNKLKNVEKIIKKRENMCMTIACYQMYISYRKNMG
jgi:hypothetical protein